MPVFHFTLHAYRSWMPDHPRGYVKPDQGILASDPLMARHYEQAAKQDASEFGEREQRLILTAFIESCRRNDWRLHGLGSDRSHIHTAVSWPDNTMSNEVLAKLKNGASYVLNADLGHRGRRWFSKGGSRKPVRDREHLDYLLQKYFPDHPGLYWREGLALQVPPTRGLSPAAEGFRQS